MRCYLQTGNLVEQHLFISPDVKGTRPVITRDHVKGKHWCLNLSDLLSVCVRRKPLEEEDPDMKGDPRLQTEQRQHCTSSQESYHPFEKFQPSISSPSFCSLTPSCTGFTFIEDTSTIYQARGWDSLSGGIWINNFCNMNTFQSYIIKP